MRDDANDGDLLRTRYFAHKPAEADVMTQALMTLENSFALALNPRRQGDVARSVAAIERSAAQLHQARLVPQQRSDRNDR